MSKDLTHCGVRNVQSGGDGSVTQPLRWQPVDFTTINGRPWSTQLLPILPRPSQSRFDPLSDDVPLQLSNG